jgi:hypothetical protein
VTGVDGEPVAGPGSGGEGLEEADGRLEGGAALLADEVAVGLVGEVVVGRAVSEVGVVDEAEPLELVEVAVDGGQVDVGGEGLHVGGQLLGRAVGASGVEAAKEQPPGRRDAGAARPELVEGVVDGRLDVALGGGGGGGVVGAELGRLPGHGCQGTAPCGRALAQVRTVRSSIVDA